MKLHLICLRTVRYSDSRAILTAYSREHGRVSLSLAAGQTRGAVRLRALTMPFSLIEVETTPPPPGREVWPLRTAVPLVVTPLIHGDPSRSTQAMFLAEVLGAVVRQSAPDEALFDFLARSAAVLDRVADDAAGMFHICFLVRLAEVLGVEPDVSTYSEETCVFDLRDGVWRTAPPLHPDRLDGPDARGVWLLSRMTYANMGRYRMSRPERRRTLDLIVRYLSLHIVPLEGLKSLHVLRSLV